MHFKNCSHCQSILYPVERRKFVDAPLARLRWFIAWLGVLAFFTYILSMLGEAFFGISWLVLFWLSTLITAPIVFFFLFFKTCLVCRICGAKLSALTPIPSEGRNGSKNCSHCQSILCPVKRRKFVGASLDRLRWFIAWLSVLAFFTYILSMLGEAFFGISWFVLFWLSTLIAAPIIFFFLFFKTCLVCRICGAKLSALTPMPSEGRNGSSRGLSFSHGSFTGGSRRAADDSTLPEADISDLPDVDVSGLSEGSLLDVVSNILD